MSPPLSTQHSTWPLPTTFQPLVEQVTDYAIYVIDLNGAIRSWNAGARAILGYATSEVSGLHFSQLYTKADRLAGIALNVLKSAEERGRYEEESQRVRKDGSVIPTHAVVYPLRGSTGELTGFTTILRDATEERQDKRALYDSERRFRLLASSITDYAIYMLDANGIVTSWNRGAQRIKGYTAEEVIGQHFSRFYTEEDRRSAKPFEALKRAGESGRYEEEGWRVRKDGTKFAAHVIIDAIHDENGKLTGYAQITRDVTEREVTARALRESEYRQRLLIESLTDYAIYTLDPTGVVISWNLAAERITGYAADEIIGEHFAVFYTDRDRQDERPHHALETARRQGRYEEEGVRVRKDGSLFAAEIVVYAIRDENGRLTGYAKITRDVTDRKQREIAELANAAKTRFLAHLSHEFRTPLNAIIGFSEIIKSELLGEIANKRYVSYGNDIHFSGTHLLNLVNDVLDLTRIEAGKIEPVFETVDARSVVERALRLFESKAAAKHVTIHLEIDANVSELKADERMMRQCLINLVDNAIKFSPPGTSITVRATRDDAWLRIRVIDQGAGMEEKDIPTALQPFRQLDNVMSRSNEGAGLGLPLVKSYCELHGGGLSIRSKPGIGTEATLRFPYPGGKPHRLSVA
ncbi:MAG: PAS domain-containing sensor histidine kinase [Alphaproteobacteria bacterium]|nr:PAS domain-containing sensor histidine kinase [Alphaproteobacteria bacterium]